MERCARGADRVRQDRSTGQQLAALLQQPSGAFVRDIVIGTADGVDDSNVRFDSVVATLGTLKPRHVRSIYLGDMDEFEASWMHAGDVSPLWPRWRRPRAVSYSCDRTKDVHRSGAL